MSETTTEPTKMPPDARRYVLLARRGQLAAVVADFGGEAIRVRKWVPELREWTSVTSCPVTDIAEPISDRKARALTAAVISPSPTQP